MSRDAIFLELILKAVGLAVVALALLGLGVVWLVRLVRGRGGWSALAARFPAPVLVQPAVTGASLQIGAVLYRNCAALAATPEGLVLEIRHILPMLRKPAVLLPWHVIRRTGATRLYWRPAIQFAVGDPPVADLVIPEDVLARLDGFRH